MNKIQLYRLLRKNTKLSVKRSPVFEQNKWAKGMIYFGGFFFALYLILYGGLIGFMADGEAGCMLSFMPIILLIDFGLRFIVQTTPAMMVKPYILLPISRYSAIECFLFSSHLSGYNLLWLAMFIPYTFVILAAGAGFMAIVELVAAELLIIFNSQIYLFFRTLINRNVLWVLAALAAYALPFTPLLLKFNGRTAERLFNTYAELAVGWWVIPSILALLVLLFLLNRHFQFKYVYEEISKKSEGALKHVSQFTFFNRFGLVGEYLKIELKSNIRNKAMRNRCIMSLSLIVCFASLIAYTDIYDNQFMTNFWCLYCYAIFSITSLIKIMGQEGNYIDLLMLHQENIIALLKAKFIFYSAVLIVPFLVMLPAVFNEKFTFLQLLAYMSITAGLLHFIIFQMAVYNKQTLPLNQKMTGKGNFENGIQIVIEMVALFGPGVIVGIGYVLVGATYTYLFMIALGLVFILTYPWWIRSIYQRMMARKYENLEGFHATRE